MFIICQKCKAGIRTDIGEETLKLLGYADGKHRCGGETKIIQDHAAGVGKEMHNPNEGVIFDDTLDETRKKTHLEIIDLIKRMRVNPAFDTLAADSESFHPSHIRDVLDTCHDEHLATFVETFVGLWHREHPTVVVIEGVEPRFLTGDELKNLAKP